VRTPPRLVVSAPAAPRRLRQLWVAIHLPDLALAADAPADLPVAVIDLAAQGPQTVVACNARAARLGIAAGLKLSAAVALATDLCVQAREPAEEARRLAELARLSTSFTPVVCVESADDLLLEVRASQRLFGGLDALLGRLRAELGARRCVATLGVAPTPTAAVWLARAGDPRPVESLALLGGRLNDLPLGITRWPAAVQETFARLGLRRLGDLVRLPRGGVARRFTPQLVAELDEAYGRTPAVRRRHVLPERFRSRLDLEAEVERHDLLEPVLHRLLGELGDFLEVRAAGVTACVLGFEHRGRPATRVVLRRSQAAGRGAEWHRLLYERLARLELPAAVNAVSLRSGVVAPLVARSAHLPGLADPAAAGDQAQVLLDRLRARLGEAAVTGVCLVEEHRPEAASRPIRPVPPARAARGAGAAGLPCAPRPLWLLAQVQPLLLRHGLPWLAGGLALESGPERIESGWWDGADVCRDYYVARLASGARIWIYRERGAAQDGAVARWYWHGVYA
jgi:protein ImuB